MTTSKRSVFGQQHHLRRYGGLGCHEFRRGPRLAPDCHGNRRRSIRPGFDGSLGPTASGRSVRAIDAPAQPVSHLSRLLAFDRRALANIQASTEQKWHIVGGDLVSPLKEKLARSCRPALVFRDEVLHGNTRYRTRNPHRDMGASARRGSRHIRCCQLPSSVARHRSHPRGAVLWRRLRAN